MYFITDSKTETGQILTGNTRSVKILKKSRKFGNPADISYYRKKEIQSFNNHFTRKIQ